MRRDLVYAGRLERLFAYLIDSIILLVPAYLLAAMFSGNAMVTLFSFLMSLTYYTYFTASRWQATPGKRILNMYVIRTDNQMLTPRDAVERFLAFILPSLPMYVSFLPEQVGPLLAFWLSLGWFASILYTAERVGMHDKLCRTRVLIGRVGA